MVRKANAGERWTGRRMPVSDGQEGEYVHVDRTKLLNVIYSEQGFITALKIRNFLNMLCACPPTIKKNM